MMSLYRKNETLFAILWIVIYVVVCGNLRAGGDDSPLMTIGLAAIVGAALLFVTKNGLVEHYGLTRWPENSRRLLYLIPLWIIASGNLWGGIAAHYAGLGFACALISMALVGVVEELIFRGFLFRAMLKSGSATSALIVSSVTFGIGHLVNLFTGHAMLETFVQVVFAIAMGFVFTLVYYKGASLLPCILAHSLIDVFSIVSRSLGTLDWVFLAIRLALATAYVIYLWPIETPRCMEAESSAAREPMR